MRCIFQARVVGSHERWIDFAPFYLGEEWLEIALDMGLAAPNRESLVNRRTERRLSTIAIYTPGTERFPPFRQHMIASRST